MSENKNKLKKKLYFSTIIFLGLLSLALFSTYFDSYAVWYDNKSQPSDNLISTSCFDIVFTDYNESNKSTSINLQNSYPLSDEKGLKLLPYEFTILNRCGPDSDYQITLSLLSTTTIDPKDMKYSFNLENQEAKASKFQNENIIILDDTSLLKINNLNNPKYVLNTYILDKGTLLSENSKTFNLRLWIDENANNSVMGKEFEAVVSITNVAKN